MKTIILITLLLSPLASQFAASCFMPQGMCIEFKTGYTIQQAQDRCASSAGTFSLTGCSMTNKVASCETTMPGGSVFSTTFYQPDWTLQVVTDRCSALKGRLY